RPPARGTALVTFAVPSACVMGAAGIAVASVGAIGAGDGGRDQRTSRATAEAAAPVAANSRVDTQLRAFTEDARDFGDRASRTQERLDLKARQVAARKKREAEAA